MGFTGFYRVLPCFTGFSYVFSWVILGLKGLTGFDRVIMGFTGFDRVLLGYNGFYWVLLSFTCVLLGFNELR